ncbi:MAG: hypothetical protein HOM37_13550 [Acidimicrobiaceae bacterium]|jgi:hypothetical protein|nr:hypothetical protein [Acidimicrobiaceae bacterium]
MGQPTSSVYLDASQPVRGPAPKAVRNIRRTLAGWLTLVGLLALSATALLGGIHLVTTNPGTLVEAANKTLDDPVVQQELDREMASAIETRLLDLDMSQSATSIGFIVADEALRLAPIILADAAFRSELETLIIAAHDQILLNPSELPIDITAMTKVVIDVIESESPQFAQMLPRDHQLYEITTDSLPDFTGPVSLLERVLLLTALATLALPLAGLLHPHYDRILTWIGRWALLAGLVAALAAIALPKVVGAATGFHAAEIAAQTVTTRLLGPAALAGMIGMGLVTVASVRAKRRHNETSDYGEARALGLHEPDRFSTPRNNLTGPPKHDPVDVSHPLTNI